MWIDNKVVRHNISFDEQEEHLHLRFATGFTPFGYASLCCVNAGGVDDDVPGYPQFSKSYYFAEDGDVILTRRLLEVNGTVRGILQFDLLRPHFCYIYGNAQPERIRFECSRRPFN